MIRLDIEIMRKYLLLIFVLIIVVIGLVLLLPKEKKVLANENTRRSIKDTIKTRILKGVKIVEGKWGDKIGEFGLVVETDMPFGPPHIAVGRQGEIYVADEHNARVQVFDDMGKLVRVISIEEKSLLDRIAIDDSGNMHLVNHRVPKIAVFDHNLRLLYVDVISDIPPAGGGVGYGFTVNAEGEPVLVYNMHKDASKKRIMMRATKDGLESEPFDSLRIGESVYAYPTVKRDKKYPNIVEIIIKQQGKSSRTVQIEEHKKIWSQWEIGVDKKGQFYYSTETEGSLFVYIISLETDSIRRLTIITDMWHGAYRCPVLGLDGNIYYMGSSEEQFWINKYTLKK